MYALIKGQELLLGPISFNYRMINSVLEEELELDYRVTSQDYQNVPISFTDEVKILPARNDIPEYDPRTQTISQSNHTITETEVIFNYVITSKTLEQIKNEHKALVKPIRKQKENTTITLNINDTEISVSTSRENKLKYITKLMGNEGPYIFKFDNDTWVEITKENLEYIISQIDLKVQEAFDWEYSKIQEIESCNTIEEVFGVVISEPSEIKVL